MSRIRVLLNCIVALAAFVATCAAIRRAVPMEVEEVTPKLAFFSARKDQFDTVFIGSSRVYHGVSPKIFDETTRAANRATHSFNLAVNGMMPPESVMMAWRVVQMRPKNLRRIFFEISDPRTVSMTKATKRDTYWHDLNALIFAARKFRHDFKSDRGAAFAELSTHMQLFARNRANLGRSTEIQEQWNGTATTKNSPKMLGPDMDGFLPEPHPMAEKDRVRLVNALDKMRTGDVPKREVNDVNHDALTRLGDGLARRGIAIVFFITPTTTRDYNAKIDAPVGAPVLAFDDPQEFPDFYRTDHRFDYDHLNPRGAEEFSRLLAQRAVEVLK